MHIELILANSILIIPLETIALGVLTLQLTFFALDNRVIKTLPALKELDKY